MSEPNSKKWYDYILNKYFIVGAAFFVWMVFFDQNSYMLHNALDNDIEELKEERAFFKGEIEEEGGKLEEMTKNPDEYERLAREKYLMKRENEDIFVIQSTDTIEDE